MTQTNPAINTGSDDRLAASLIGISAILVLAIVIHHPVAESDGSTRASLGAIEAVMQANLAFHALLMVILVAQFVGLALFAQRLGIGRAIVIAGAVLCAIASILMIIAMTFDGFVTVELMAKCTGMQPGCGDLAINGLSLASATIQAFTKLGLSAQALGLAALAMGMWLFGGHARIAAALCTALALSPLALVSSGIYVGPERLVQMLSFCAAWSLVVAIALGFGWLNQPSVETTTGAASYP